ncbi:S24 family peptidase [Rhizobium sp. ZK1]|uniref:S24 family peptidase n=1 Tax=Rhizobium sp. ZK1 TaxID=3389872 RepID=UPI0039F64EC1
MPMDHVSLLKALIAKGHNQDTLAEMFGVSQSTISRWLKGSKPDYETVQKIRRAAEDIGIIGLGEGGNTLADFKKARAENEIPEIDLIAGLGGGGISAVEVSSSNGITFATEVVRDHWRLPDWMLNRMNVRASHVAAFPCRGDSMAPTIDDGDVVFVDTRHRVPSPPGVYALADEFGGVIVKRLEVTSRPGAEKVTVRVSSDNPRHLDRELDLEEIQIVGAYVGRFTI